MQPTEASTEPLPFLAGWLKRWEELALIATALAIVGMIVFLLFPEPKAVISLAGYAAQGQEALLPSGQPVALESTEERFGLASRESTSPSGETAPDAKRHKTRHFWNRFKKPKKPPITNLNTASADQLQLLPGIGPKMAERILEARKANGRFTTIEQVMDVKGIGPRKFEKLKAFLKI